MNKTHITPNTSIQLGIIVTLIVVAVAAYLYFLNMSVIHVVMRKEAVQESAALRAEIALLETRFIEAKHTITRRVAELDGYYDTEVDKVFVMRGNRDTLAQNN